MGSIGSGSAASYGLQGIQSGFRRLDAMASKLREGPDAAAIVDGKQGQAQLEAGVAVLRASDEMLGTLIDTLA